MQNLISHYFRKVWYYEDANTKLMAGGITAFNCQRTFSNTSVNEKVDIFNKLKIMSSFVLHETVMCDDKDAPRSIIK